MSTVRATYWSVTAYGDNIARLEDKEHYPRLVKEVDGGREQCPKTKRIHYQGRIVCRSQQRRSALSKWLPGAHFEPAKDKDALKAYVLKEDTAVGPKTTTVNERKYLSMAEALTIVGSHTYVKYHHNTWYAKEGFENFKTKGNNPEKAAAKWVFWIGVREHVKEFPDDISLFSQPQMERAWTNSWGIWQARAEARGIVLPAGGAEPTNEVCWEARPTLASDSEDENRSEGYQEDAETQDEEGSEEAVEEE